MTLHEPLNEPRVAKLTVDHFMRLDAERAFGEVSKTELIDGVVYTMNAQYRRHALAKTELYDAIPRRAQGESGPIFARSSNARSKCRLTACSNRISF